MTFEVSNWETVVDTLKYDTTREITPVDYDRASATKILNGWFDTTIFVNCELYFIKLHGWSTRYMNIIALPNKMGDDIVLTNQSYYDIEDADLNINDLCGEIYNLLYKDKKFKLSLFISE